MLRQRYLKKGEVHELEGRSMKEITEAMGISVRGHKGADLPRPTENPVWTGPVLRQKSGTTEVTALRHTRRLGSLAAWSYALPLVEETRGRGHCV